MTDPTTARPAPQSGVPFGSILDPPNAITLTRIGVSVGCFVALSTAAFDAALLLFVLAAATDFLDGYWARRWGPITRLGRILDPFADKLLIGGAFVYLAATPGSGVAPGMAVVVLARELLVTTLRAAVESGGRDFSATPIGKWKMVTQCVAVGLSILMLAAAEAAPGWLAGVVTAAVGLSVAVTVASAVTYTHAAVQALRH